MVRKIDRKELKKFLDSRMILRSYLEKTTRPRSVVIYIFQKSQKPLSAQDILEIANRTKTQLSLKTIYRVTKMLQKISFIHKSHIKNDRQYYEM